MVLAVAVLEVVDHACGQLEHGRVAAEGARVHHATVAFVTDTAEVVDDGRFQLNGPCFLFAYVEVEVQTELHGPGVGVVVGRIVVPAVAIVVQPSETADGFHFEEARLAFIACEEVHQVDAAQKADICGVESCWAVRRVDGGVAFEGHTQGRREVFVDLQTYNRAHVLPERIVCVHGCYASGINTHRPVVGKLCARVGDLGIGC